MIDPTEAAAHQEESDATQVRHADEPARLLEYWMEWEKGETPPGRVIANLKKGGLREVLETLVAAHAKHEST